MHVLSLDEGEELVSAARRVIGGYLDNRERFDPERIAFNLHKPSFGKRLGVFVTLSHFPTGELRGCVGYKRPTNRLGYELVYAALSAAFGDPRFVPISHKELEHLTIEISLISEPVPLPKKPTMRARAVRIGRDGLVAEYGIYSGLLLPQVAVENSMDADEFLEEVCRKANLPGEYWKQPNIRIYKFETQIFKEEAPNGKVTEIDISKEGS